jgi:hypothetical protein
MASLARYGMEMRAMQERPWSSATTADALEQEVVFSTAATVAPQRHGPGYRFFTSLWRALADWTNALHRRPYSPPYYLESARLSREIDRL